MYRDHEGNIVTIGKRKVPGYHSVVYSAWKITADGSKKISFINSSFHKSRVVENLKNYANMEGWAAL